MATDTPWKQPLQTLQPAFNPLFKCTLASKQTANSDTYHAAINEAWRAMKMHNNSITCRRLGHGSPTLISFGSWYVMQGPPLAPVTAHLIATCPRCEPILEGLNYLLTPLFNEAPCALSQGKNYPNWRPKGSGVGFARFIVRVGTVTCRLKPQRHPSNDGGSG